jgi:choline dehydrogenase
MAGFDYVVVGAGSAGCVLAARLSEDPTVTVALIEAGGPDTADEIHIPVAFSQLFKGPYDWDLDSEPEPGLAGRRAYLPRGKVFGGCSSMNAMVYIRGNRVDYDTWAAAGATGWSYDDVLPYFVASEDNERGADAYHGVGGPLSVSDSRSQHELSQRFVDAAQESGLAGNPDFNAASQEGVGIYQVTQRNGMRCSAAVAYLHPAMGLSNLTVIAQAHATRVLLDGDRATGVEIIRDGSTEVISADREVIVSAGSYESPKLLMLSGIGPAPTLTAFGIATHTDLPVGQGLQDHVMTMLNWRTDVETLATALTPANVELLQTQGRGPLTSNIGEAGGFLTTRAGLPGPDVQLHMAPVTFYEEGLGAVAEHGYAIGPCVLAPTSRGYVTLRSPNPLSAPRILHNYLGSDDDRASILAGIRIGLDIARQAPLADVSTGPFLLPDDESDAGLLDYAARTSMTLFHPTSSCAIGPVVDPELRVHGFANLRVVDASVLPSVTRGNTNAPTIMVAEKAADLLRGRAPKTAADEAAGSTADIDLRRSENARAGG